MWIIIYIIFLIIEFKIVKKDKVDILNSENLVPILFIPSSFVLSVYVILWTYSLMNEERVALDDSDSNFFYGYYLSLIFGAIFYMIYYIKRIIYAFISNKNKLKLYRNKHIFYVKKS